MGQEAFDAAMSALWAELGVAPARPRADGRASLTVDGRRLDLVLAPDERTVLVSADLGPVSRDPVRCADQMRRLLREGCGLMLGRAAALRLRPGSGAEEPDAARVEALAPCDPREAPALVRAIEAVLFLADVHAPTLAAAPARPAVPALGAADLEGSLIFRL